MRKDEKVKENEVKRLKARGVKISKVKDIRERY